MKHWNDLDGTTFFNKVFTQPIKIDEIYIHSLRIENDQPGFGIGFDIPEFPDHLPEKWKGKGYNTCRIGLTCSEVRNLRIVNLPCREIFIVKIEQKNECFIFSAKSKTASIEFEGKWLSLSGPSVYMNVPEPEDHIWSDGTP
ncbi:Imm50 family immunity protein [Pseudomonas putida]